MLPEDWVVQLRAVYPKRSGGQGWAAVPRLLANETDFDALLKGTKNYAVHCQRAGKVGTELVLQARTFFGRDRWWEEFAEMDMRTPAEIARDARLAALSERAAAVGVSLDGMDERAAAEAVNAAEREAQQRMWRERGLDAPKFAVVK